jgi:hypothetical protein
MLHPIVLARDSSYLEYVPGSRDVNGSENVMEYATGHLASAVNGAFRDIDPGFGTSADSFPSMTVTAFVTMTGVTTVEGQLVTSYIG